MSLNQLISEHVTTVFLNTDHFAETVTFHCPSGPVEVTGIIEIDPPIRDDNGVTPTQYTGQIHIASIDVAKLSRDKVYPLKVTAQGYDWHVTDSGHDVHGMQIFGIARQERKSMNAITLDGKQPRYARVSPNP
jgi:hypothetical protein